MKVKLISLTRPEIPDVDADDLRDLTPEGLIVYVARVSSPQNQANLDTAPRLLRYLVEHRHWSPFELVDMTVEIETSRAIAAQILRHRSFSFQEFSQRYARADMGFERYEGRRQADKNRQGSVDDLDYSAKMWFDSCQAAVEESAQALYDMALQKGVAREQARMILPLSTRTRMYMKGSVRSWIHYLQARLDPAAQREHRDVAAAIAAIFRQHFPVTSEACGIVV